LAQGRTPKRDAAEALQRRLIDAEVEREVLQAQLVTDRDSAATGQIVVSESAISAAIDDDPRVRRTAQDLAAKESMLSGTKAISVQGDDSPLVRQLKNDIHTYQKHLQELREGLRPETAARLVEKAKYDRTDNISRAQTKIVALDALQARL